MKWAALIIGLAVACAAEFIVRRGGEAVNRQELDVMLAIFAIFAAGLILGSAWENSRIKKNLEKLPWWGAK